MREFWFMILGIGLLVFADICKMQGVVIRDKIKSQDFCFRVIFTALTITALLLFGIWGNAYDAQNFIYFQF